MSTALNVHLLSAEELLKYTTPVSELEKAMAEKLKELLDTKEEHQVFIEAKDDVVIDLRLQVGLYQDFFTQVVKHLEAVTNSDWGKVEPPDLSLLEAVKDLMTGERPIPQQVDTSPKEPPQLSSGFVHDCID